MTTLRITANTDYSLKLIYKDSDGVVIPIDGASARMMVRRSMYADAVVTATATINGTDGEIIFDLVPDDTAGLLTTIETENYIYDVELTLASGKKSIILSGELFLKQSVTRD